VFICLKSSVFANKYSIESIGELYLTRFTRSHSVNNISLVYKKQERVLMVFILKY